jgi:hypothetical protein
MRRKADELPAVFRQDRGLKDVEAAEPADDYIRETGLRDRRREAIDHDLFAEQAGEVGAIEHERAIGHRPLPVAGGLADRQDFFVVEVPGDMRVHRRRAVGDRR